MISLQKELLFMDGLLSISQLAKLRNVTTETLRHYDRINLFKPTYVDPETNYRYYSILQYEKLGTILELRHLGFPLDKIRDYFEDRNIQNSYNLLKLQYKEVCTQIEDLTKMEQSLKEKIQYIESIDHTIIDLEPSVVSLPQRYFVTRGKQIETEEDMGYAYTSLERMLNDISPILATDRVGVINYLDANGDLLPNRWIPFIFLRDKENSNQFTKSFPEGLYGTIATREGLQNQKAAFQLLKSYLEQNRYEMMGDVLSYFPVDLTITDSQSEFTIILQIQVKPCDV
jgi:DNA-binding transcriptional MerR regulator